MKEKKVYYLDCEYRYKCSDEGHYIVAISENKDKIIAEFKKQREMVLNDWKDVEDKEIDADTDTHFTIQCEEWKEYQEYVIYEQKLI